MYHAKTVAAVLLMGGSSHRFSPNQFKQLQDLDGAPLYLHALNTFLAIKEIDQVLLVCHRDIIKEIDTDVTIIEGGSTRQLSVKAALNSLRKKPPHFVIIHDIARPFVTRQIIMAHLEALSTHSAVNTCICSTDTICIVEKNNIISIPNRNSLRLGQTPQSFSFTLLDRAHAQTTREDASDDCLLIKELDLPLHFVEGEKRNFKITTREDLVYAQHLIDNQGKTWQRNSTSTTQQ